MSAPLARHARHAPHHRTQNPSPRLPTPLPACLLQARAQTEAAARAKRAALIKARELERQELLGFVPKVCVRCMSCVMHIRAPMMLWLLAVGSRAWKSSRGKGRWDTGTTSLRKWVNCCHSTRQTARTHSLTD